MMSPTERAMALVMSYPGLSTPDLARLLRVQVREARGTLMRMARRGQVKRAKAKGQRKVLGWWPGGSREDQPVVVDPHPLARRSKSRWCLLIQDFRAEGLLCLGHDGIPPCQDLEACATRRGYAGR